MTRRGYDHLVTFLLLKLIHHFQKNKQTQMPDKNERLPGCHEFFLWSLGNAYRCSYYAFHLLKQNKLRTRLKNCFEQRR